MAGTGRWARLGKLMFGRYLLLTNTASCGGLLGVGDLATQSLEKWAGVKDKYDWRRTGEGKPRLLYRISHGDSRMFRINTRCQ